MYKLGERYYSQAVARFTQADPLSVESPSCGYSDGDPVNSSDPTGLMRAAVFIVEMPDGHWYCAVFMCFSHAEIMMLKRLGTWLTGLIGFLIGWAIGLAGGIFALFGAIIGTMIVILLGNRIPGLVEADRRNGGRGTCTDFSFRLL